MTDRLSRVRAAFEAAEIDALLVSSPVDDVFGKHSQNRQYLSGFSGSTGIVLVSRDRAILAVDFRYVEQAEREAVPRGFELFRTPSKKQKDWLQDLFAEAGLAGKRLGVSSADFSYGGYLNVAEAVSEMAEGQRPELKPAKDVVEGLRKQKDAEEIALLQRAIDIADEAYEDVSALLIAGLLMGVSEREVARRVEEAVRGHGAESVSFDTIVAAGPWAAMPHASPRDEPLPSSATVVIDMGAQFQGYCSDLTRTFSIGEPDAKFREIYDIVFEAQQAAIEGVRPGMGGAEAHALAADVIARYGYGEQFGHGLGHGVGLQVHEAPYLGPTSEDTLEEGMVFTIEPGIYIPGWSGVRIEDVVVLENGRARVLSHAAKITPVAYRDGATR